MTMNAKTAPDFYSGDGSTKSFATTFKFFIASEVLVRIYDTDDDSFDTDPVLNSDFTISGGADANGDPQVGTVTFVAGFDAVTKLSSSKRIMLWRQKTFDQDTTFNSNQDFDENDVEHVLDECVEMIQDLAEKVNRSVRLHPATLVADREPEIDGDLVAGKFLSWSGTKFEQVDTEITGIANPMTSPGDLLVGGSGGTPARLGLGTAGQGLFVNSGATASEWVKPTFTSHMAVGAGTADQVLMRNAGNTNEEWAKLRNANIADHAIQSQKLFRPGCHGAIPPDLRVNNNSSTPDSKMDIDWDRGGLDLFNNAGDTFYIQKGNFTADIGTSGVNGLDTGTETNVWYYFYIIANLDAISSGSTDSTTSSKLEDSTADFVTDGVKVGDVIKNITDGTMTYVTAVDDLNTLSVNDDIFVSGDSYEVFACASLISASSTAPTLPAGYDVWRRVSEVRNISGNFLKIIQVRDWVQHNENPSALLSNGVATSFTDIDLSSRMPPTAREVALSLDLEIDHTGEVQIEAWFRTNGSAASNGFEAIGCRAGSTEDGKANGYFRIFTDSSQVVEYKLTTAPATAGGLDVFVTGYRTII